MFKVKSFFTALLFLTLSLLINFSYAQSYYFRNYSVEDGLPFVNVSTIFQDSKGNLWTGGYGGLSKFDGISFTNYSPKEGLLNHNVTCITEDKDGNLWVGSIGGVNRIDPSSEKAGGKKFSGYTTEQGMISNYITSCAKDKKGNLWFGTDKGISKLSSGSFTNFTTKDGLINNSVKCIFVDIAGNVWFGTREGLSMFDGSKFTNYNTASGLSGNTVNCIGQDVQNNVWIGTETGLCKLNENKIICYGIKQGLNNANIKCILNDNKNVLWIGTESGLMKFANETFTKYPIRKDQNSNLIACLYQDYENNLWIGTYSGLFKYRGNPFVSYSSNEGLTSNFIFGILRDSKNHLWVGSQGSGLFLFDGNKFKQFDDNSSPQKFVTPKGLTVNGIHEYSVGKLWLATDKGLRFFDGKNFSKNNEDNSGVFNNNINCIYKDSKQNIWLGGNNELFKFNGSNFKRYTFKGRNENYSVWTIIEDLQGNIWAGTYLGGLAKLEGNNFRECSAELGLINDSYLASVIDKQGNIYLASLDGVWMFNPENPNFLTSFNRENGMSSNLVYSLNFGKTQNEIWAGTNQGLNKIDLSEFKLTGKKIIIPFGKEEGFSGIECNTGGFVDPDGSIWFGTVNGLIKYNPAEYLKNISESKTSITGFRLFYTDTVLNNNVHLPYNDNNITFTYSGICLTNPVKVKYSHILEGFQKNWSPPSTERFQTYSNLPPGTYTFKVKSSNNEEVWNKKPASFTFIIERPFWKTWWFNITIWSALLLIVIFGVRYRIRQIKNREKRKTELNKKIANIESQALRSQMNPHFIFNTLSSIQHYISNSNTDDALKYLSKFAKLMRSIMDNSKQPMISIAEELNALQLYLELEAMRFKDKFDYKIDVDKSIDTNYDRIPSMLIQPYVENAILHGLLPKESGGKISISLLRQDKTILCTIEDNGIGRIRSQEFKKNRVQQHKSMGMSITQERLDILNSSLNSNLNAEIIDLYENGKPSGTKVKLIIPLDVNDN